MATQDTELIVVDIGGGGGGKEPPAGSGGGGDGDNAGHDFHPDFLPGTLQRVYRSEARKRNLGAAASAKDPVAQYRNSVAEQLYAREGAPAPIGHRLSGIPQAVARYDNSRHLVFGRPVDCLAATGGHGPIHREQSSHELFLHFYRRTRSAPAWRSCRIVVRGYAQF